MKEKTLLTEKEIKEKQMMIDRDLAEKRMQLEREMKAAETLEKDKQLQVERELKERELQLSEKNKLIESAEKDKTRQEERMEREKEKMKADYEIKLELNKQNLVLQSQLKFTKSVTASVGFREPPVAVLVDVSDSVPAATDASFLPKLTRLDSSYNTPVNSLTGHAYRRAYS